MEKILNSVKFYYNIAFNSSLESYLENFLMNSRNLLNEGYTYFPEYGHYMRELMILDDDVAPIFATDTIDRNKYIKIWLEENNKKVLKEFHSIISSPELLRQNINVLSDSFDIIFKRKLLPFKELLHKSFFEIIDNLETLDLDSKINKIYILKSKVGEGQPPFNLKEIYSHKFFNNLYDFFLENNLISEELDEESFVNTLFGYLKVKIIFQKDMYHIVYLFEKLKIFFDDFTNSKIEEKQIFFTKSKRKITVSNINAYRKRLKESTKKISDNYKYNIDDFIKNNIK